MNPSALNPFPAILAALAFGIAAPAARAQAAPCAPVFKAIHDFKVGDMFQYRIWKLDSEAGVFVVRATETVRQYRIDSRADSGGTLSYRISGLARTVKTDNGAVLSTTILPFEETLRFTDSAGHRLNRCQGDIVPFPEAEYPGAHTRVRIVPSDSGRSRVVPAGTGLKILGEIIGTRVGDTGLSPLMDFRYSLIYAEGLGLVQRIRAQAGGFSGTSYSETLTAYMRDGATYGVLEPDLAIVLSARPAAPARARARAGIVGWPWERNAAAYDLRGRRLSLRAPSMP